MLTEDLKLEWYQNHLVKTKTAGPHLRKSLIQQVWGGVEESVLLTSFLVMLMLLVWGSHF